MHEGFDSPALHLSVALAVGMIAQSLARHLRIPGIVLLLGAGVLLGPDVSGVIRPEILGDTLPMLVGFAVAVILFEGGLNLRVERLRREARSIRQLITVGAAVTGAGGAIAARLCLGWSWELAVLFGTLVIVTGPTVIGPILKRVRLSRGVATVLEAEGVLIDPIGAIAAVVALEIVLHPAVSVAGGGGDLLVRLGLGTLIGATGGAVIAFLLRFERIVPEGLENVFILSLVLALFQISNALLPESGIMAVTVAGLVVGNFETRQLHDLREFKEQLTVMLIGMLFVLLAADVRVEQIQALGMGGVWTVLALMLVVRPLNIWIGTAGSGLSVREKAFLSWMAPRGIVAAAVSSLFAQELNNAGIEGGSELRALVFLVIAATVLIQGLTGGLLASLLGVRRPSSTGVAILGANPLALAFAEVYREADQRLLLLDSSAAASHAAEERGFRIVFGNALEPRLLARAEIDSRAACIALTPNDEVNLLFTRRVREVSKTTDVWTALSRDSGKVTPEMVHRLGGTVLWDAPQYLGLWSGRIERRRARVEKWMCELPRPPAKAEAAGSAEERTRKQDLLPLAVRRGDRVWPYSSELALKPGDELHVLVQQDRREAARAWQIHQGWREVPALAGDGAEEPS